MIKYISTGLLFLAFNMGAQAQDSLKVRPGQVTFFYPLGTNGINSISYRNNFSFNVLYGINGGFTGAEIGGIVNVNSQDIQGAQIGGIANINGGKADGVIIGGIANVIRDSSNTLSFAGVSNVMGKSAMGMHVAGISNLVNGDFIGAQIGGITNTINGHVQGAQFSGISNIVNGNLIGCQVAGISNIVTGNLIGAQFGLINTARQVKGFQLGLINVAESYEKGVPLGLISYVKNGFHGLELSSNESIFANLSLKLGVNQLYTIYRLGFAVNNGKDYMTYGLGIGGMHSFTDKMKVALDITANHVVESSYFPRLDILSKADFSLRYHLNDHLGFFAGPTVNVYVSQFNPDDNHPTLHVPYAFFEDKWWNNKGTTSLWVGGNIGMSFMF